MKFVLKGLETPRLRFDLVNPDAFHACMAFFEDDRTHRYWKRSETNPLALGKQWYERQLQRYALDLGGMNLLYEKSGEQLVGWCGLLVQEVDGRTELEIGYSLMPSAWGKGFASEAATAARDVAWKEQYATSLISIIQVNNLPSQKVAMRVGMQRDGNTTYQDNEVYIYRIHAAR